jgi:hypothetical protein
MQRPEEYFPDDSTSDYECDLSPRTQDVSWVTRLCAAATSGGAPAGAMAEPGPADEKSDVLAGGVPIHHRAAEAAADWSVAISVPQLAQGAADAEAESITRAQPVGENNVRLSGSSSFSPEALVLFRGIHRTRQSISTSLETILSRLPQP